MMYLISEERLKQFADLMRSKTGDTEECSLEEIKNKLEAVRTENDFLKFRECDGLFSFYGAGRLTTMPKLDTRAVTNMNNMFSGCSGLTTIPQLDTSSATEMGGMFYGCSSLTTIPQLDTSSVTFMNSMFSNCSSLTTIPQLDTRSATFMNSMFSKCSSLTTIPQLDTSSATDIAGMFIGCSSLTTIPQLDTSSVTDMNQMFSGCTNLTTIPQLDTRSVTNMKYMFRNCSSLTTIPQLDTSSATHMDSIFSGCTNLTNCYLRNIKSSLIVGSGTTYGHLLTVDSLLYMIKELVNTGSSKTLTMGTANTAKLSNTYVKLINITDEMRAEDDLINSKLPFEVCEKTDEGALAILTDYVALKNWSIK